MEVVWNHVDKIMPERIGNYLCITNDELIMVCHVVANGWWSMVPGAQYYGDMGDKVTLNSKQVPREVVWWSDLPTNLPPSLT